MRIERAVTGSDKGWWAGTWNSSLPIALGYATAGIDEPHVHRRVTEIYLVAVGTSTLKIEGKSVQLGAGDVAIVEPGEAHTFLESSIPYFHFVIHSPSLSPEEVAEERSAVQRSRLGL